MAGNSRQGFAWPIPLKEHLPVIRVPLRGQDPDVPLDLQQALGNIYDIFGYDALLDYTKSPPGPHTDKELAWVEEHLRRTGRRKG